MKYLLFLISTCSILIGLIVLEPSNKDKNSQSLHINRPSDPIIQSSSKSTENELEELKEKAHWYNSMHSIVSEENWQQKDLAYRFNNQLSSTSRSSSKGFPKGKWIEKGAHNQAGRIVYAIYDSTSNEIKAASAGGTIWKSDLDSLSWLPLNDHHRIDAIIGMSEINLSSSKRLIVASSLGHVFYSDDNAISWSESQGLNDLNANGTIRKMVTCSDSSVLVLCNELNSQFGKEMYVLYFSNDGASSFSSIKVIDPSLYGPLINFDLHSISNNDPVAFYYYRDSIAEINGADGSFNYAKPAYPFLWGEVMLTGGRVGDSLKLFVNVREYIYSSNGDASYWTHRGIFQEKAFSSNSMSYSMKDTSTIMYGGIELYTSRNGGNKWSKVNNWQSYYKNPEDSLHADIPFIGRFDDKNMNEFHLIGTDGGLYISHDQLKSVKNISLNHHQNSQYYSVYTERIEEKEIYAGSQDQGFQRVSDDTFKLPLKFNQIVSGDYGHITSSDSGKAIWASSPNLIGYIEDASNDTAFSQTWNYKDSFDVSLWLPPVVAGNGKKAFVIGLYKKGDANKDSKIIELEIKNNQIEWLTRSYNFNIDRKKEEYLSALSISPINDSLWYAMTNKGNFYYSFDQGNNWNRSSFFNGPGPHEMYGSSIYASKSNENEVYAVGSGYSNSPIFYSWNKGRDWRTFSDSLPSTLFYKIDGNENDSLLFTASELGPFVYSKSEGYWSPLLDINNDKSPDQIYWDVEYLNKSRIARFATFGRGIWDFEIEKEIDTTISVSEETAATEILNVYPNPCSGVLYVKGGNLEREKYEIYSLNGKLSQKGRITDKTINTAGLKNGAFIIRIIDGNNEAQVFRFVKISE